MAVLGTESARFWVTSENESRTRGSWVDRPGRWVSVQWEEVLQSPRCAGMVRSLRKGECLVVKTWRSLLAGGGTVVRIPAVPVSEGTCSLRRTVEGGGRTGAVVPRSLDQQTIPFQILGTDVRWPFFIFIFLLF